jgi:hypothetical protein
VTKAVNQEQTSRDQLVPPQNVLRRKCECGNHTVGGGQCSECAKKQNTAAVQSPQGPVQRKLMVGHASDQSEREADKVADHVSRADSITAPPRLENNTSPAVAHEPAPDSVNHVLSSGGSPLDRSVKNDMEARFGQDFSRVRVHSGAAAEDSARDVHAEAYTVGNNIVFGAGKFAPATQPGRHLLAHELTHVVQQSGKAANPAGAMRVARQTPPSAPQQLVPHVTPEIEAGLIHELQRARIAAPPSASIRQESVRTFAVAAIIKPDGSVTYESAYFDKGSAEHAEPQLLTKIDTKIKPGDMVAIAIDQVPCSPSSKNCSAALKQFRADPNHGSMRVYTVRSLRRDVAPTTTPQTATPGEITSPKTAATRPVEQRFLLEEKEFRRIRLPMYKEPPAAPAPAGPAAAGPTGPAAPQQAPPVTGVKPPAAPAQTPSAVQPPSVAEEVAPAPVKPVPAKAAPAGAAKPNVDPKKALQRVKVNSGGSGFKAALKTAAAAAALDFVINALKGYMSEAEIQMKTEAQLAALHPQIEAMLATNPKQIHAVVHVFVFTVIRDVVTQSGVEERMNYPMATVSVTLSETAVEPTSSSKTELITMGSIQYNSSTYSMLLIDVEKEQARQELERKEEELKRRINALAEEEKPPAAAKTEPPKAAGPPSLLPQPEPAPAPLLPGAPGPSPLAEQETRAANLKTVGSQLLAEGQRLRNSGAAMDERQKFKRKVQVWRGVVQKAIRDSGNYKAVESLTETLARFDERMNQLGSELGIDGWKD